MNLKDLIAKMTAIEEGKEQPVEECGMMPMMPGASPQQQDNVNMNITMSGQGAGGIRDLMSILKSIENGDEEDGIDVVIGKPSIAKASHGEDPILGDFEEALDDMETYGNSAPGASGKHTHGVDAVTFSGDDMNSKGKISPLARAPGTNPLRHPMHESLVNRLQEHYNSIK